MMTIRPIFAVAKLTVKAAFRFRLVAFLIGALAVLLAAIPYLVEHNGSADMFAQVILTYTSSLAGAVLGLSTLWLACGTMAQDIAQRRLQLVSVKPVAAWQIWLGKWLGITALNGFLLLFVALAIYGAIHWHARALSPDERRDLKERVLVARGVATEPKDDRRAEIERIAARRLQDERFQSFDPNFMRDQVALEIRARDQIVQPNYRRVWNLDLGRRARGLKDRPLHVRARFHAAGTEGGGLHRVLWRVGGGSSSDVWQTNMTMAANAFHEFPIPSNLFSEDGTLRVECHNRTDATFLFPLEDGLELLVPEGGFLVNLLRAVGVLLGSLSVLAALGLTSAALLSFPVAAFLSFTAVTAALAAPMLSDIVSEGGVSSLEHSHGENDAEEESALDWIDRFAAPTFEALSDVATFFAGDSPIERLTAGRSVSWADLGLALTKNVVLLSGAFGLAGALILRRRELAL